MSINYHMIQQALVLKGLKGAAYRCTSSNYRVLPALAVRKKMLPLP